MIQFGDSTIRLAEIARGAGRAVDAVNELWPLVNRLETRAAEGHGERDTLMLLAQDRLALGVALGDVLPEERLAASATWTGKALLIARRLGDRAHLVRTLRTHGNELRRCNRTSAAVGRLHEALALSSEPEEHGNALALLARAAGQLGDPDLFDQSIGRSSCAVQRVVRAADDGHLVTLAAQGRATLQRLLDLIAPSQPDVADN